MPVLTLDGSPYVHGPADMRFKDMPVGTLFCAFTNQAMDWVKLNEAPACNCRRLSNGFLLNMDLEDTLRYRHFP